MRRFPHATGAAAMTARLLSPLLLLPSGAAHAQQTAYAIAGGGTTLIRFQTDNPGAAVAVGNFNGAATSLDGIDFRPLNGQLYGYRDATDTLYTVDVNTATLTVVASGPGTTSTNRLGIDFNPTIDRVRVVTDATENLVSNPNSAAAPTVATSLFYAAGDPGANTPPGTGVHVIENAYTNNITGAFPTTVQYGIDYNLNSLVTIANNLGTLNTVGGTVGNLGITINNSAPFVGFDIFTTLAGVNTAYAVFDTTPGNAPGLYTINLATGAATAVGGFGGFTQVRSLAVTPTPSVVPEAGTGALLVFGCLAFAAGSAPVLRRRQRREA